MKPRKPIARIGKRGLQYRHDRAAAKLFYTRTHFPKWRGESGDCQSCGRHYAVASADFSHKVPAGRKSNCNGPEHGIYSCRTCHNWLEHSPVAKEARQHLIASPISMQTGGVVAWGPMLGLNLLHYIAKTERGFFI